MRDYVINTTKEFDLCTADFMFNLYGSGECTVKTGVSLLDFMIKEFVDRGHFDFSLEFIKEIDLETEQVMLITGNVIGKIIYDLKEIMGVSAGHGEVIYPIADSLVMCIVDFENSENCIFDIPTSKPVVEGIKVEFFQSFLGQSFFSWDCHHVMY